MEVVLIKVGVIGFFTGAILGSCVLALADRSLTKKSFWGRSYCLFCKAGLRWYDLFPVLSYIYLKGRCRYCKKRIGIQYPLIEVAMGVLVGYLFYLEFQIDYHFLVSIAEITLKTFFITVLSIVFITDYRKMFIPDRVILPAIVIGLISLIGLTLLKIGYLYFYLFNHPIGKYLLPPYSDYFLQHSIQAAQPLLGGVICGLLIGGFFYLLILITQGKGMGGGDVKLGAFIGLMLGFPLSVLATFASFLLGAAFSVALILIGKKHFGQTIAFGPFLVIGALIALFWGNQILDWYLTLKIGS